MAGNCVILKIFIKERGAEISANAARPHPVRACKSLPAPPCSLTGDSVPTQLAEAHTAPAVACFYVMQRFGKAQRTTWESLLSQRRSDLYFISAYFYQ
jgi:hypothetical protein